MHQSLREAARGALLAAICVLPAAAMAQSTFTMSQLNRPSGSGGPEVNEFIQNPATPMLRSISDPPNGSASSFGQAGFGVLKASATATADSETFGRFFARSAAGFSDTLTFASAGNAGSAGFMTAMILFDRNLHFNGNPLDSYAVANLHVGTSVFSFDYQEVLMLQPSGCNPFLPAPCAPGTTGQTINGSGSAVWLSPNTVSVQVPIVFGVDNNLAVGIDMSALASFYSQLGGGSTWEADAAHSLYWGGISNVTDSNGNSVTFDLSSASGTNYLQSFVPSPIPEPETYVLMLAGLWALRLACSQTFKPR